MAHTNTNKKGCDVSIEVTTQAELDQAVAAYPDGWVTIIGPGWFSATNGLVASGSATVEAYGSATVEASGSATVVASGSATVRAYGSATVRAYGSVTVEAYGSVTVEAYGSATVEASDSVTVRASDSVTVRAYGSATVEAYGSVTVEAYGSATVRASDSATVEASDSATVRAGRLVAIHNHNPDGTYAPAPKITGGVVINVRPPADIHEWLADHHIEPDQDGVVVLFKAVDDNYVSSRDFRYTPGTTPVAPDWDGGKNECGGGLHFCGAPWIARTRFNQSATRFVACPVRVTDIAYRTDQSMLEKVKAKGCCAPVWECDIDGERVTK